MRANVSKKHASSELDPVTAAFVRSAKQVASIEDGFVLADAARHLAERVGAGSVLLLARNPHAAALAAACAVIRAPQETTWQMFHIGRTGYALPPAQRVVIVEPAYLGDGLRQTLLEMYPGVTVIDGVVLGAVALRDAA